MDRVDGRAGIDRMWDSQWVNVVNAPAVLDAETTDDAVNAAVALTEQAMAKNYADREAAVAELIEALEAMLAEFNERMTGVVHDELAAIRKARAALATANRGEGE